MQGFLYDSQNIMTMRLFGQHYYSQMCLRIQARFYKYSFRLLAFIGCGAVVPSFSAFFNL